MSTTPTTLTFRGLDHSDAIEADVHERVAWLEQFYPNITSCRVLIEIPHRHQRNGRPFHVRIDLSVPGRPPIVVSRDPSLHGSSKDIEEAAHHKADTILGAARHATVVVHEAFDAARRQLQDLARGHDAAARTEERSHMFRSRVRRALLLLAVIGLSPSLGAAVQAPPSLAPADWDAQVKLKEAVDHNPDPRIVEIDIVARVADVEIAPGKRVKAWTYDGGLPGPFIRVHMGDRLIVHFTNQLPQETTIHWHGVRVPITMDGVPGISQDEVEQGKSFTYDFTVPDAGLYWYHPHVQSAAQVGFGLYGALLVEDPAEATTVGVPDEVTLVLSDIGFDDAGTLDDPDNGDSTGMVFGREGTYVLVNGKTRPTLRARSGAPQRWRVVNAAKSRFFVLNMDGFVFTIIGSDGGLQESATTTEQVLITPGERVDLIVTPTGAPGTELVVRSMLHNRGYGSFFRNVEDILTVRISDDPPAPKVTLPKVTRTIMAPPIAGATRVPMTLTLPPIDWKGHNEFQVNGVPFWKSTPYLAKVGETQIWVVKNDTDWDHPFHLHGFFFIPLDEHDQPIHPMGWKDTVNIPQRTTARLLVQFNERPGTWMFHCHILDHAEGGLMGHVQVGPVAAEHMHLEEPKPR